MVDYSRMLFDAFSGPGDAIQKNRDRDAAIQAQEARNVREDRRFDYQTQTDERDYARRLFRDEADDNYRAQTLALQQRSADRLEAAAGRPSIETFYDDQGRETKGIYDPSSPLGFRPVGGAKTPTGNIPNGYQPAPGGGLTFIPGGPADPSVISGLAGARGQGGGGRPLPAMTIKDLGAKGQSVDEMNRLTAGFDDSYGGYGAAGLGDAANVVGRNYGLGYGDQAAWWQDYQSSKNLRRNQLFGSALTAHEKSEFEKADINPGMSPATIRTNLARQEQLAAKAARKLASAYAVQGYSREAIEAALGMSLDDVGGSTGGGGGRQQQPSYQTQDIEAELRRRGLR